MGTDTLLSTVLGPAVVVASGWGWILVVAVRCHGGMVIVEVVVVVEKEEAHGLF